MAGKFEQEVLIRVRADGVLEVEKVKKAVEDLGDSARRAGAKGADGIGGLASSFGNLRGILSSGASGVEGFIGSIAGVAPALLPMTAALAGAGLVFAGLGKAIGAAAEEETSIARLEAALRRTGEAGASAMPGIKGAIDELFEVSKFDDEALRGAAGTFVTITGNAGRAAEALGPIADLAASMGMDVEQAATLVARASEGMVGSLSRVGISFTDAEKKMLETANQGERMTIIFEKLRTKVGGAAAAELGTYAGQVAQMKKNWGELAESLGGLFLPIATKVIGFFADLAAGIQKATEATLRFIKAKANLNALLFGDGAYLGAGASGSWEVEEQGPKDNAQYRKGAADLAASLAKAREEAVATKSAIADLMRQVQDSQIKIETAFETPDLGPIAKAVDEVRDKERALLDSVAEKSEAMTEKIAAGLAKVATLRAEIDKARLADKVDDAAIAGLQAEVAQTLKVVTAARQASDAFRQMPDAIREGADAAAKFAAENAIAKAGKQAAAEWQKFAGTIDDLVANTEQALSGLIGGSSFFAEAQRIGQMAKDGPIGPFISPEAKAEAERIAIDNARKYLDALKDGATFVDHSIRAAADYWAEVQNGISASLGSAGQVFLDAAHDAGADFGVTAVEAIAAGLKNMGPALSTVFGGAVLEAFGAAKPDASNRELYPQGEADPAYQEAVEENDKKAQQIAGAITGAFSFVAQQLNAIKNAQAGQQVDVAMSAIGGALSGASIGASIGSIFPGIGTAIGAVIGAIVGALIGGITAAIANAKSKALMAWADFGIDMGKPFIRASSMLRDHFSNVTSKEIHDFYAEVAKTMEEVTSGFINLLLKFPDEVLEQIGNFPSIEGLRSSPDLGVAIPSDTVEYLRNFSGNLELWLKDQLPKDIAEYFKAPVKKAFTEMEMTADRFDDLWNQLQGMDPKQALQILNDTADALIMFRDVYAALDNLNATMSSSHVEDLNLTATGEQRAEGQNDFMYQLGIAEDGVAKLAKGFASLPFAEQAAAARNLASSVNEIMAGLVQYLNQIAEIARSIGQDAEQRKFQAAMQLAGGDKDQQLALINAQYDKVKEQLANASQNGLNPADVQNLYQQAADLAAQAFALDPTKEAFELYSAQLDYLASLAQQQLEGMANAARSEVEAMLDLVRPFADFLRGDVTSAMDGIASSADLATGSLSGFSVALDLLSARLASDDPFGEHTGLPGGGDPGNQDNPTNEPPFLGEGTPEDPYRPNPAFPGFGGGGSDRPVGYDYDPTGGLPGGKGDWWNPGEQGPITDPYGPTHVDNLRSEDPMFEELRQMNDNIEKMTKVLVAGEHIDLGELMVNVNTSNGAGAKAAQKFRINEAYRQASRGR